MIGYLDGVDDATGRVWGWACDPDAPQTSVSVHFYADGPAGKGRMVAATNANKWSEAAVRARCGGGNNHRFEFFASAAVIQKIGKGSHSIYAHGIDTAGGPNPTLSGSPKYIYLP